MWWKLCQVVVPALCAADICASNAETFPGIAPGEDSIVLEAPFHRTTPTAEWRQLLSGEVTEPIFYVAKPLKTPWGTPYHQAHTTALLRSNQGSDFVSQNIPFYHTP